MFLFNDFVSDVIKTIGPGEIVKKLEARLLGRVAGGVVGNSSSFGNRYRKILVDENRK